MNSAELRRSFLDFFKSKSHTIEPSASLLPTAPNLLFTNAGMNPFVPYFLDERPAPHPRIANTQKCIRAGGKHNDLEDVGFDGTHHTFFEMLGNWSFGDYFKRDAIAWAWELLTHVWKFPKERLYATVYKPGPGEPANFDQEAFNYWKSIFEQDGLDPAVHICTGGKQDNFWMMGETGPCGPCSEIHVDLTPKGDTHGRLVNQDAAECLEIWNLVFIQFNAEPNGTLEPLPMRHVDTGMGLERVAGIFAATRNFTHFSQKPSNYTSDLFSDLFAAITDLSGKRYGGSLPKDRMQLSTEELNDCAFRVLADHTRALCIAISDGILPGNEGRHYVLRRILRRALLFGKRLNLPDGALSKLAEPIIEKLSSIFPELRTQRTAIAKVLHAEEQTFARTLDRGLQLIDTITAKSNQLSGEKAFTLYDTYGFPIDLTQLIARERGLHLDLNGFYRALQAQRARAQAAHKKTAVSRADPSRQDDPTPFVGYDEAALIDCEAHLIDIVVQKHGRALIFDKTPFYAEMGGQIGDSGTAHCDTAKPITIRITHTKRDASGRALHHLAEDELHNLEIGQPIRLCVDLARRRAIERHHSATHIIHWAVREVLGTHIRQAGSIVTDHHLRFDYTHYEAPSPKQLATIEKHINEHILANTPVSWYEVPFDKKPDNCLALFGEKYGAIVRVVNIGGYSLELCAGTHVQATGAIGFCKILSENAVAAGTRRIEAVAGMSGFALVETQHKQLHSLARKLSCTPEQLDARLDTLLAQRTSLEKRLKRFQEASLSQQAETLADTAKTHNGLQWVVTQATVDTPEALRSLAVKISQNLSKGIVILGAVCGDKATLLAICSEAAIAAGYRAGDYIKRICAELGGKGGGKPDFAMGGAQDTHRLREVLSHYPPP